MTTESSHSMATSAAHQDASHPHTSTAEPSTLEALNAELTHAINQLGASVMKVKASQTIEDQAAVEDLEARYIALRRNYEAYETAISKRVVEGAGDTGKSEFRDRATEAFDTARDRVSESYTQLRDYFSDDDTKARLRERSDGVKEELTSAWNAVRTSIETTWQELRDTPRRDQASSETNTAGAHGDKTVPQDNSNNNERGPHHERQV